MNNQPEICPFCGVSLLGEEIPDKYKQYFFGTHYKREIGIYNRDRDRTVAWRCPDCGYEWERE